MMINDFDIVVLKKDIPEKKLSKGLKGCVVMIYNYPDLPIAYEVEFFDDGGVTVSIETLYSDDIELSVKSGLSTV